MRSEQLPHWLQLTDLWVIGYEGENNSDGSDDSNDGEDENEDDDDATSSENNEEDEGKKDDDDSGALAALKKERKERKRLEKEAKALQKFKDEHENKDKSESEKATKKAEAAEAKAVKLAAKLQKNAVDTEVMKFANKLGFKDVDDAISLVKRDLIEIEQDEDDPADIEIDVKSVERAVKKLAESKPHLVKGDNGEGDGGGATGGKFGGKNKDKQGSSEEDLRKKYPALGIAR